jgi:periplasmic divalent cation tolerance protein
MFVGIYITCSDKKEAEKISLLLLKDRLVACCNIIPIKSLYWWHGKIEDSKEFVILAKTKDENFDEIEALVKKKHSYKIPAILAYKIVKGNKDYLDWMDKELQ